MSETTTGLQLDLRSTLIQVANSAAHIERSLATLAEGLRERGLQLSSELSDSAAGLRRAVELAQQQSEALLNQTDRLHQIIQASGMITTSLELDQVLGTVMESVIALSRAERAFLVLRDDESGSLDIRATHHWDGEGAVDESDAKFSRSVVESAFTTGKPILTNNAQMDSRFQSRQSVIGMLIRSVLCVPLLIDARVIGVLYIDNRLRSGIFREETVQMLSAFGAQAAIAIEKARLHGEEMRRMQFEKDLSVAREIQFSLLPKALPTYPGWSFAAAYQPARVVGGDFYDFFNNLGMQGIVIADVADKGVGAAIYMSLTRTMIRTAALANRSPAQALVEANDLICQDSTRTNIFLSAFYALVDPLSGRLVYANAGHNPPLHHHANTGTFDLLRTHGVVLGLFEQIRLVDAETCLEPGDTAVFYTDGVTEAMSETDEEYGEARLKAAAQSAIEAGGSAQMILETIMNSIAAHVRDAVPSDDVTLVIVKRG